MLMVPERAVPVFACTPYETAPFPVPDVPPVTMIQAALLDAVHVQLPPAVIVTDPELPPAGTATVIELRLYVQLETPNSWLMTNVWLPRVTRPERGAPEFAWTL